jgi:hypothetical protein
MKLAAQLIIVGVSIWALSSCMSPDAQYIAQTIPVKIQGTEPVTVEIRSLSGGSPNEVGIRCGPDVWNLIMADKSGFSVRLVSTDKEGTNISDVSPGGGMLWPVVRGYHLFHIGGRRGARATVQIKFPATLRGITNAEVIVMKTPADTGL